MRRIACVASVLLLMSAGCDGNGQRADTVAPSERPPASNGPVSFGESSGATCVTKKPDSDFVTFGETLAVNSGQGEAKFVGATLLGVKSAAIQESFTLDIEQQTLVGTWSSWPPRSIPSNWAGRKTLAGSSLAADDETNLIFKIALTDGADRWGFDAVEIKYLVDGREYVGRTVTKLLVKGQCF